MDLDEEGRTILGFWGLGRREWDGRLRKKRKRTMKKEKNGMADLERKEKGRWRKKRKRTKEEDDGN